MSDKAESATFMATLPSIMSAIKIYGSKEGMRVQLEIPESEMAEATKLLLWRERVLKVTIEPADTSDQPRDTKTYL